MNKSVIKIIHKMNKDMLGVNVFNKKSDFPLGKDLNNFFLKKNFKKIDIDVIASLSTKALIDTIIKTNQYVYISKELKDKILKEYHFYYSQILDANDSKMISKISIRHQRNLIDIFSSISELKAMDNGKEKLDLIPCSEYSPRQQLEILDIEPLDLKEPILDIGCGTNANLVHFLRDKNYLVYGIDRTINKPARYTRECSWLEFNYGTEEWGTIIAHLSFTNHFKREHLKKDGNYVEYAQVYMRILNSLKKGGSFYYTPSLKFIEHLLDESQYHIESKEVQGGIGMTILTKI